jgi:hypothetical protein
MSLRDGAPALDPARVDALTEGRRTRAVVAQDHRCALVGASSSISHLWFTVFDTGPE